MPLYRATVIVLRRRSFEETDKLLTLYSREHGKLSAIAKGARRAQSRLVGATEPLVYSRMQLATGRNLDIISEATTKHTFSELKTTSEKIEAGLYALELTDALVEERQPSDELFDLLLSTLYLLEGQHDEDIVMRRFEMQALDISGYGPELRRCVICRAVRPDTKAAVFSPQMGGILCSKCRAGHDEVIASEGMILDMLERLRSIPAHGIGLVNLSLESKKSLKKLTHEHISHRIERRLKSQKC